MSCIQKKGNIQIQLNDYEISPFEQLCEKFPVFAMKITHSLAPIDGSTDRCCIAIVTNERALLSGSDQPVRKLGRFRILYVRRENKRSKTATFAQWYMVYMYC